MKIKFRNCNYEDWNFILRLKELGMKWYVEKICGWDFKAQEERTKLEIKKFKNTMKIIVIDDKDIGVTNFFKTNNEYAIGLILIHPDYQGKGIATKIINNFIDIARKENTTIRLKTYKYNPAKKLYERLGFIQYNEDNTHVYMHIEIKKN